MEMDTGSRKAMWGVVAVAAALVAATAGATGRDADYRGNIVGSEEFKLEEDGGVALGAMFKDIGDATDGLDIQNIVTDASALSGATISWWDGSSWAGATWDGEEWLETDRGSPAAKVFATGEGFVFHGNAGDGVRIKGELRVTSPLPTDIALPVSPPRGLVANPAPATLHIQDIGVSAKDDGGVTLSWWDGLGFNGQSLWLNGRWRDFRDGAPSAKTFPVGEAFMIDGLSGEEILAFPNPLAR